jgi:2-methylcitrate dehydratase PrpD
MTGITARLAAFAATLAFDQLPAEIVLHTKLALLDTFGGALAASGLSDACDGVLAYAVTQTGQPGARIWPSGQRVAAGAAALANGMLARALDCDDIIENPQIHVSACVVPAALAIAEDRAVALSGRDLLAAVAIGSEIQCRLAAAMGARQDPALFPVMLATQVFGYFSGAAAAGRLLGLTVAQMHSAFGLAMMQAAGTEEMVVHAAQSVGKNIYTGFSSQGAVQSAQMAAHGVLAQGDALEGRAGLFTALFGGQYDPALLTDGLGEQFIAGQTCFKYWPGTLVSHAFIEAALQIRAEAALTADAIASVRARVGVWGRTFSEPLAMRRAPPSASAAMNSVPFIVSRALVQGTVGLGDFFLPARDDPATAALAAKFDFVFDAGLINPVGLEPGLLEITAKDGRVLRARVDQPKGHHTRPLSFDDMARKFRRLACLAAVPLPPERIERIIATIAALDTMPDVRDLTTLLVPETNS